MTGQEDHQDRLLDQNLRSIGRRVPLPAAPTEQQRNKWKQAPGSSDLHGPEETMRPTGRGGHFMRNRRMYLPAGTALAAAIVMAFVLLTSGRHNAVAAETILQSFRDAPRQGLRIVFSGLQTEEMLVDGRVSVLFDQPWRLGELISGEMSDPEPSSIYVDATVAFSEAAREHAGLHMQVAAAIGEAEEWAYVQGTLGPKMSEELGAVAPLAGNLLNRGVMIDLEGVFEGENPIGVTHTSVREVTVGDGAGGQTTATIETDASVTVDDAGPRLTVASEVDVQNGAAIELGELEDQLEDLLAGRLDREGLEALVLRLDELAGDVDVEEVEPGLYVLTARDLSGLTDDDSGDVTDTLAHMVVAMGYRVDVGVEWLNVDHLLGPDGHLEIAFINEFGPADQLNRADYVQEGVTFELDAGACLKMFGSSDDAAGEASAEK